MSYNKDQFRQFIISVLIENEIHSDELVELLLGTSSIETSLGQEMNGGAFNMDQVKFDIAKNSGVDYLSDKELKSLDYDLKASVLSCAAYYLSLGDIPTALIDQAIFWHDNYRTALQYSKDDFIRNYKNYIVQGVL